LEAKTSTFLTLVTSIQSANLLLKRTKGKAVYRQKESCLDLKKEEVVALTKRKKHLRYLVGFMRTNLMVIVVTLANMGLLIITTLPKNHCRTEDPENILLCRQINSQSDLTEPLPRVPKASAPTVLPTLQEKLHSSFEESIEDNVDYY
jgi:hypothetical protein